jgi:hypothetical protein
MAVETMTDARHGDFALLLKVDGASDRDVNEWGQRIHDEYMDKFGDRNAMTIMHLKFDRLVRAGTNAKPPMEWNFLIRYFGPPDSVGWLQEALARAASGLNATVTTQTMTVTDMTGRY